MTVYDGPTLEPERDVAWEDGQLVATSDDPWLGLIVPVDRLAGRLVEITYRASFWDEPARPVMRFWQADGGFVERIAVGPIAGAGIWTGRVPPGTQSISVSPTNRPGPFGFAIERVRTRPWASLLAEGFQLNRRSTRSAILTRLIGWRPESDVNLAWATGATPISAYPAWHARRARPIDLAGIDRPRSDWTRAEPIRLHLLDDGADTDALARTRSSLDAQVFSRWTIAEAEDTPPDAGLTGVLRAGDILPPHALAYLAEQARRAPDRRLFYGDAIQRDGTPSPALAPGWSPRLFTLRPALLGSVFVRDLARWPEDKRRHFLATGTLPASLVMSLATDQVMPLRRVMVERRVILPRATGEDRAPRSSSRRATTLPC